METPVEKPKLGIKEKREAIGQLFDSDQLAEIIAALDERKAWLNKRIKSAEGKNLNTHEENSHLALIEGTPESPGLRIMFNLKAVAETQHLAKDVDPDHAVADKCRIEGDATHLYVTAIRDGALVLEDEEGEHVGWAPTDRAKWSWEESCWIIAGPIQTGLPETDAETTEEPEEPAQTAEAGEDEEPTPEAAVPVEEEQQEAAAEETAQAAAPEPDKPATPEEPDVAAQTAQVGHRLRYSGDYYDIVEVGEGTFKVEDEDGTVIPHDHPVSALKWHGGWSCWMWKSDAVPEGLGTA